MSTYPKSATKVELDLLKQFPALTPIEEQKLLDTPEGFYSRVFPELTIRWLRLYKKLLRAERPAETIAVSLGALKEKREVRVQQAAYEEALKRIVDLEQQVEVLAGLEDNPPAKLLKRSPKILRNKEVLKESALVTMLSDWHCAEEIMPEKVHGRNRFNLDVCRDRVATVVDSIIKLWRGQREQAKCTKLVVCIGGDICNGELREEAVATNLLGPIDEVLFAQGLLVTGINRLLDAIGPKVELILPIVYGNHGRLTHKLQYKRLRETSVEYMLALNLHSVFHTAGNVEMVIAHGSQAIVDLFGYKVRFHHGNSFNYNKGIGGVEVPARRGIARWNKSIPCELDVFGHFHQFGAPRGMLMNGSLCGYNEYALAMGFEEEPPLQGATLIDSRHGRRGSWPLLCER